MNWKLGEPVTLETENYLLRSLRPDDVTERYLGWFKDPEVVEHAALPIGMNEEQHRQYLARFNNAVAFNLGISLKPDGDLIGFLMIFIDPYNKLARTAVTIGERDYWGKGVVIECRAAALDFLFETVGIHKVWGKVNTRNIPSVFNYKAQGFTCEGVMREHGRNYDGSRTDQYLFGLLKEFWDQTKATPASDE